MAVFVLPESRPGDRARRFEAAREPLLPLAGVRFRALVPLLAINMIPLRGQIYLGLGVLRSRPYADATTIGSR